MSLLTKIIKYLKYQNSMKISNFDLIEEIKCYFNSFLLINSQEVKKNSNFKKYKIKLLIWSFNE
ncbi:hypothetical protein [Deferribacter desulfuricans]|uniref:hypothetical protein n=1 Tax=Deferribacter desulfuricans TaxID=197162 RepID=UPI00059E32AD|nr:hypothetical protein [Deferribacter desulfuricans]